MSFIVAFVNIFFLSEPLKITADNVHSRLVAQILLVLSAQERVHLKTLPHLWVCANFSGIGGILETLNPGFLFFFSTAVISTTMSFKLFVNLFFLAELFRMTAGNLNSRYVAQIGSYCRHKNVYV